MKNELGNLICKPRFWNGQKRGALKQKGNYLFFCPSWENGNLFFKEGIKERGPLPKEFLKVPGKPKAKSLERLTPGTAIPAWMKENSNQAKPLVPGFKRPLQPKREARNFNFGSYVTEIPQILTNFTCRNNFIAAMAYASIQETPTTREYACTQDDERLA